MDDIQNNIRNTDIKKDFLSNERKSSKIEIIKNPILLLIVCLLIFEIIFLFNCLPINTGYKKEIKKRILSEIIDSYSFKAIYSTSSDNQVVTLFNETYTKDIIEISLDNEKIPISSTYTFPNSGNHTLYFIMNSPSTNSLSYLFNKTKQLVSISFSSSFNTENVIDMRGMFYGCSSLSSVENLSNLNTKNVIDMSQLFYDCSSLTSIDFSGLNTENVKNMSNLLFSVVN